MIHFLDVGAGRGEIFTLDDPEVMTPEMRRHTVLHCFEPSPRNFVHLVEAARQHAHEWAEVKLYACAVGDNDLNRQLFLKTDHSGDSLFPRWSANDPLEGVTIFVPARDICSVVWDIWCDYMQGKPWASLWLKLDCEGAEFEILKALVDDSRVLPLVRRLWVEWHLSDPAGRAHLEATLRAAPNLDYQLWNH